jgi:outer membrane protein OmpA-like peptidoglycan-associated protein
MHLEDVLGSARRAALCTCLLVTACGRDRSPPLEQPIGETHTSASPLAGARQQGQDARSGSVAVEVAESVRRACDLPDEPREAPRFDFDSAQLLPRGEDILARVASCVTARRLGDASLRIVGRTDPRGDAAYNQELGLYRALAAKQHLLDLGVPSDRIVVESRGERDARGTDEASWVLDRRIEVRVDEPAPAVDAGERQKEP